MTPTLTERLALPCAKLDRALSERGLYRLESCILLLHIVSQLFGQWIELVDLLLTSAVLSQLNIRQYRESLLPSMCLG